MQDVILIFSKGHYSRKGDNLDKKTNVRFFFHEEAIYEISKPWHAQFIRYGMQVSNGRTDGWTDRQSETNMPCQLLEVEGINIRCGYSLHILCVIIRIVCARENGEIWNIIPKLSSNTHLFYFSAYLERLSAGDQ